MLPFKIAAEKKKKQQYRNISDQILPKPKQRRESNTLSEVQSNDVYQGSSVDDVPKRECQRMSNDVGRDSAADKAHDQELQGLSF